jgi:hypothetical protein
MRCARAGSRSPKTDPPRGWVRGRFPAPGSRPLCLSVWVRPRAAFACGCGHSWGVALCVGCTYRPRKASPERLGLASVPNPCVGCTNRPIGMPAPPLQPPLRASRAHALDVERPRCDVCVGRTHRPMHASPERRRTRFAAGSVLRVHKPASARAQRSRSASVACITRTRAGRAKAASS